MVFFHSMQVRFVCLCPYMIFSLCCSQDNYKKPNYVQISVESYSHLTGLEDQIKTYEEQVQRLEEQINELNEKLSSANSEITTKENLVKQHMKVAEEAVSGILPSYSSYMSNTGRAECTCFIDLSSCII